jgi:TolB-like protein
MSLFAELQRRSVFKVGAAYLVVAWLLIQVAATVAPQLGLPEWAPRLITLMLLLGFPVALLLAWAFELTPEGVKVDARGAGSKRMFAIAVVLAALALGWYLRAPSTVGESAAADKRSIAVLPFVNMSGDADNEYFSDGISEEILNSLAQMPDVKVAARTSSFSFKGKDREIPDIARELEVRMVLEGSVRKQGERVRITAQLIDATKGFHVWSQTYDRDLQDIFAIQDEIAHAIAAELKVKLGSDHEGGGARPDTTDLAAYDDYLKGMQLWQARGEANIREADRLLRAALARDPGFAKAWAGLAVTLVVLPEWSLEPREASWLAARDAAEHAIALDPTLPEPYAALGYIALSELRFATGRAMFARTHEVAPSYATGWQWHGEGLMYEGAREEALAATRRARELDPKSAVVSQAYANQLWQLGRDDDALAVCDAVLVEHPGWLNCSLIRIDVAALRGDYAVARAELRRLSAPRGPDALRLADEMIDVLEGKRAARPVAQRFAAVTDGTLDPSSPSPMGDANAALWLITAGEPSLAMRRVERLHAQLPNYARALMFDPHLAALHCLPEYQGLAKGLRFDPVLAAQLCARSKGGSGGSR